MFFFQFNHTNEGGTTEFGPAFHKHLLAAVMELQNYITDNVSRVGGPQCWEGGGGTADHVMGEGTKRRVREGCDMPLDVHSL